MECEKARRLLAEHHDGELKGALTEELKAHLEVCAGCAEELRELASLGEALRGLPRHTAPEGFAARVTERLPAGTGGRGPLEWLRVPARIKVAEAAVLVIMVAAGVLSGGYLTDELLYGYEGPVEEEVAEGIEELGPAPPESLAGAFLETGDGAEGEGDNG